MNAQEDLLPKFLLSNQESPSQSKQEVILTPTSWIVETIPTNITPEEKKVKKAAHPHKPKTAQDSVATETDVKATKKRDRAEDDGSEDTTEGEGGEIELAVKTLPTPPRPTKRGRPSKADIVAKEALAAGPVDETEGQEV
jgi:hypothetical protein